MLLKKIIKKLPIEKKKLKISGISNNSKKIKKRYIFFAIKGKILIEKFIGGNKKGACFFCSKIVSTDIKIYQL